jgi:hypothetical protein
MDKTRAEAVGLNQASGAGAQDWPCHSPSSPGSGVLCGHLSMAAHPVHRLIEGMVLVTCRVCNSLQTCETGNGDQSSSRSRDWRAPPQGCSLSPTEAPVASRRPGGNWGAVIWPISAISHRSIGSRRWQGSPSGAWARGSWDGDHVVLLDSHLRVALHGASARISAHRAPRKSRVPPPIFGMRAPFAATFSTRRVLLLPASATRA